MEDFIEAIAKFISWLKEIWQLIANLFA